LKKDSGIVVDIPCLSRCRLEIFNEQVKFGDRVT
jgi:hypothetical protein